MNLQTGLGRDTRQDKAIATIIASSRNDKKRTGLTPVSP
jgi:hypothetical protein